MKLLRYGPAGREKPGILDKNGKIRALDKYTDDLNGKALAGDGTSGGILEILAKTDPLDLPLVSGTPRIGPCVGGIGKVMCIGLNYADHAAETGAAIPAEPILFMKATSAVVGPNDDIQIPRGSQKTDWEAELAVVIGKTAKYVDEADAMEYVAGYACMNDVSERAFQGEGTGQWTKGKSCDTFGPLGPWLVTKDEVKDSANLSMWLDVNGQRMQDGNTKTMIFGVPFLIHYLSQLMTLHPGDVITTGTPPGVGLGMKPPTFLKPGDGITMGIAGLGTQSNRLVQG